MALPENNTKWPPVGWSNIRARLNLHSAWYSGNPQRLAQQYESVLSNGLFPEAKHWGRMASEDRVSMVHLPLAGDISGVSATLLFSEHPKIRIAEAFDETAPPEAVKAQDALETMIEEGGFFRLFHEAAEWASAHGGVYLKLNWDSGLSSWPIISVAQADCVVGEFRFGMLTAATVVEQLDTESSTCLRLVERHEPGVILTGLYRGTSDNLGVQIPLESYQRTRDTQPVVMTGLKGLSIVYVPNRRPNRDALGFADKWHGSSDYAGVETDLDALDNIYTQIIRDIELGMTRIHVPESMIQLQKGSRVFKLDKEVYVGLPGLIDNPQDDLNSKINVFQGEIRAQALISAALEYISRITSTRGYSPATFGIYDDKGGAESGTALRTKHMKSISTTAQKAEYWLPAIRYVMRAAMDIAAAKLQLPELGVEFNPAVEMQDAVPTDFMQLSQAVKMLRDARSLSRYEAVKMQHPDWDDAAVLQEVDRLEKEDGAQMPALPGEDPAAEDEEPPIEGRE